MKLSIDSISKEGDQAAKRSIIGVVQTLCNSNDSNHVDAEIKESSSRILEEVKNTNQRVYKMFTDAQKPVATRRRSRDDTAGMEKAAVTRLNRESTPALKLSFREVDDSCFSHLN